ncbi:bifunctional (p)ppGpp synthetase/guanosine-3',5'-bis(diphosphate) 3'-pyrophosphohydrolase [Candidatus Woesearchaeota archaeon]|nr:bifunctional (p)ppGpp synthetase/guanosine-3',5'-bis(diphosphate) 3'-pyrophosphohydrolase [Candidatus Woesearchaeota archaeon]
MDETSFVDFCRGSGFSKANLAKLEIALDIARDHLSSQKRLAGDSYFDHIIRVAQILVESKVDPATILASIVQDTLPYNTESMIKEKLGEEVLNLARGVAEIKAVKAKSKLLESEALRRVILAAISDIRIIVIKLANKLDNLRQLAFLAKEEQVRVANEVLEFYAPLAYRLGMEKIRTELENTAFAIVNPRKYQEIMNYLHESQEKREKNITEALVEIKQAVGDIPILKIKGRPKHIYSIFRKMTKRGVHLQDQFDLLGVRIIVPEIKDCYSILGKLHENFDPIEGKLKDYIAHPKPNFYRSIHTTLILPHQKTVEVQIRTEEMNEFAEEGVAAHWKYKGVNSNQKFEKKMSWLKGVLELQKEDQFLEAAKVDVFGDTISCYTPKGDLKELPEGASILDFAYQVHEQVGNTAIGGRVNGKFVPLKHKLSRGDVVEIITNKNQRPRMSWLKIVKSGKTRQRIRKYLQENEKLPALFYRNLKPAFTEDQGILVESEEFPNAVCLLAKCCKPLPGTEIVGIATKRRIISVHSNTCRSAVKEESRWINVNWKETFNQKIKFYVLAIERSGLLADVLHTIARAGFEVKEAKAKMVSQDVECSFLVIPRDLENLLEMISRIRKVKGIKSIYFE